MYTLFKRPLVILCLLGISTLVLAHEFWLYPADFFPKIGQKLAFSINVGEDYVGERWGGGERRVTRLGHLSIQGEENLLPKIRQGNEGVEVPEVEITQAGTQMIVVETNNSFIELAPDKFTDYLKEDGLDIALRYREQNGETQKNGRELYRRCAKTILQVGNQYNDFSTRPVGSVLEILPIQNPYNLKGKPLTCRFLYEGKPLQNALTRCWRRVNGKTEVELKRTNQRGEATFTLPQKGKAAYMVSVVQMVRLTNNPQADWQSTWGSMTFGLK